MKTLSDRLYSKIERDPLTGCFNWTASKHRSGYGQIKVSKKTLLAHRVSYQLHYGVDPLELNVCHKCDNPSCINPQHLFLGTHTDNMQDMVRKGRYNPINQHTNKTHCKNGHEFTVENTYYRAENRNHRLCKVCNKLSYNKNIEKRRAYDRLRYHKSKKTS